MNLPVTQKHFLSFSRKLFLSVISLFLVFAACFMAYQYQREKEYKVELLNIQLQDCNNLLYEKLYDHPQDMTPIITDYLRHNVLKDLRITVVNLEGKVLFDSQEQNTGQLGNHIGREEIQKALHNGIGFDVRRTSETTGVPYFYSATLYKDYIIRSALPYSVSLINNLKADPHYIWFTAIVTLLLMVIFYKFTNKLGTSINQLREFAMRADRNEPTVRLPTQRTGRDLATYHPDIQTPPRNEGSTLHRKREADHTPPDFARGTGGIQQRQERDSGKQPVYAIQQPDIGLKP